MKQPLVSVIVTTYNNTYTLAACLGSITAQTYKNLELVVVDNFSTDDTLAIAQRYTSHVFTKGPERSAQRNYAAQQATGEWVLIIDSDMELAPDVVSACVEKVQQDPAVAGVIIPEESFGEGFWAHCKQLERSFYAGQDAIEAARFFARANYHKLGGYDENMVSGEDWDLSNRMRALGKIARITEQIRHNEGHLQLWKTLKKKYYYARRASAYLTKTQVSSPLTDQSGPLQRYKLFLSRPTRLLRAPHLGAGMLFMKTCEYGFGGLGYIFAKRDQS